MSEPLVRPIVGRRRRSRFPRPREAPSPCTAPALRSAAPARRSTRCLHAAEVEQRIAHDGPTNRRDVPVLRQRLDAVRRVADARARARSAAVLRLRRADGQATARRVDARPRARRAGDGRARAANRSSRSREGVRLGPSAISSAGTASGVRPSSTSRCDSVRVAICDSMLGTAASVSCSTDFARSTSNAVPRPACKRSCVSATVFRCTSALRSATASCRCAPRSSK